ncbi:protein indeterminate-domain 7-like [Miscanthus floridulus]|uniref:protein indeterminate-domain 7-like n=1 Tax=Miscanthus floridulus TaxID=154761 RepID=UPI00345A0A2C
MSTRSRRFGRVIGEMQMEPQGFSLQQNSTIAPGDVASSKKKRNRPGNPRPDAEVVALSPQTLMATNRFVCEVCHKGFQRDQNLQLHLRGHNMPWKLKQKNPKEPRRRVYLCPEPTCVHHNPSRALGDLTGIKKHYCRKHGEKNLKCDKCNKRYAVESDWKAHCKTCGTREYRCECNAPFSRKDSFVTHRAMCEAALAADRETAQMPPPGAGLYVDSGSDSQGLGLSGAAAHMHGFADQGQSSSAAEASLFDHVMASYSGSSSMFRSQAPSDFSLSFFLGGGAPANTNQYFSEDGGDHAEGSQGPLLHGKEPFHGHDMMQLQEQQHHHQPGSSNANINLPGFFSGTSGGWSGSNQQVSRLVIQDQFNGGAGGGNTEHSNVMASIGSHFVGGGFPSLQYNSSPSPSAGLSATALLMKAAQMGSTSSTTRTAPSALLRAAGFMGTVVSGQGTSRAAEEGMSHEAHFQDLIMNSLPSTGGSGTGGFSGTAGLAGVDDGSRLSTRDFLGVCRDDAMAPAASFHMGAALDPTQVRWYM